jgi:FAD synthetase
MEIYNSIQSDPRFGYARETLEHISAVFDTYGPEHVSLCFNGGKDCTVLMHLLVAAFAHRGVAGGVASIPIVYFKFEEELEELEAFIADMSRYYRFQLTVISGPTMKDCVATLLTRFPRTRAMFMGQRLGDPGSSSLSLISPSDPSWPPLDRVNSILTWSYQQVWQFLLSLRLPFCRLYELGYTSLGARALTVPNPLLSRAALAAALAQEHTYRSTPLPADAALPAAGTCPLQFSTRFPQAVPPAPEPYTPSEPVPPVSPGATTAAASLCCSSPLSASADWRAGAGLRGVPGPAFLADSCLYLLHYHAAAEARRAAAAATARPAAAVAVAGAAVTAGTAEQQLPDLFSAPATLTDACGGVPLLFASPTAAAAAAAAAAAGTHADGCDKPVVARPPPTPFAHPLLAAVLPASLLWEPSAAAPSRAAIPPAEPAAAATADAAADAASAALGPYNGSRETFLPAALRQAQLDSISASSAVSTCAKAANPAAATSPATEAAAAGVAGLTLTVPPALTSAPAPAPPVSVSELVTEVITVLGQPVALRRWPYAPAWVLRDAQFERAGRIKRATSAAAAAAATAAPASPAAPAAAAAAVAAAAQ